MPTPVHRQRGLVLPIQQGSGEFDTPLGRPLRAVGSLYYALLTGVAMQYIVDPDHAPTAQDMATVATVPTASRSL